MTSGRSLLLLLVVIGTTGCAGPLRTGRALNHAPLATDDACCNSVYLIRHGWHTALAVKRAEISPVDWPESLALDDANFVEIGWGDASYLRAGFMNPIVMLNAALLPSRSAIHVAGFREPLEVFFEDSQIIEIKVTPGQMRKLCRFIHDSYKCDANDSPRLLGSALYGSGGVYLSNGYYYIPNTCNIWTAKALKAADCPVAVPLCTIAHPLVLQSKRFGHEIKKSSTVLPVIYPFCNFRRPPS